ncbi:immunoglobulin superfamily member 6 [Anguilla rostrata]|uniref:immunoglobulin superfamily member 6 n=1 Tax=Anguilla rostrata TaxID=7938 RepID=UPI0030CED3E6
MVTQSDMITLAVPLLFQLSVSLVCLAESRMLCRTVISQPDEVTAFTAARATILPCNVTHRCPNIASPIRWFVFRRDHHEEIHVQLRKYSMDGRDLTIHSPQTNDSGVYYCSTAMSSTTTVVVPSIGNGTRLVVREKPNTTTMTALLWTLFAVLALYSLLILSLLICKKTRREIFRSKRRNTPEKRGSTRRLHFHAVVQELYGKGNLRSAGQNTAHSHHGRFENPHAYSPDEDVYQNM